MAHDLRCERSKSKRCRCGDNDTHGNTGCHGAQHGIQAGETGTYTDECAPGLPYPELGHDLKRASQQFAAYNEGMFAESGIR